MDSNREDGVDRLSYYAKGDSYPNPDSRDIPTRVAPAMTEFIARLIGLLICCAPLLAIILIIALWARAIIVAARRRTKVQARGFEIQPTKHNPPVQDDA